MKIYVITVHLKFAKNMARFLISFVALFAYANGFCMNMPGGIGEYHQECTTTSIGMFSYKYTYSLHYTVSDWVPKKDSANFESDAFLDLLM